VILALDGDFGLRCVRFPSTNPPTVYHRMVGSNYSWCEHPVVKLRNESIRALGFKVRCIQYTPIMWGLDTGREVDVDVVSHAIVNRIIQLSSKMYSSASCWTRRASRGSPPTIKPAMTWSTIGLYVHITHLAAVGGQRRINLPRHSHWSRGRSSWR